MTLLYLFPIAAAMLPLLLWLHPNAFVAVAFALAIAYTRK